MNNSYSNERKYLLSNYILPYYNLWQQRNFFFIFEIIPNFLQILKFPRYIFLKT